MLLTLRNQVGRVEKQKSKKNDLEANSTRTKSQGIEKTRGESLVEERERERRGESPLPLREKSLKELARNCCNGKERSVTDRQIARYDDENSYF